MAEVFLPNAQQRKKSALKCNDSAACRCKFDKDSYKSFQWIAWCWVIVCKRIEYTHAHRSHRNGKICAGIQYRKTALSVKN